MSLIVNPHFGPAAQTPAQRAVVLACMQQALPNLRKEASPYVAQLHARYLAGELTWPQVYEAARAAELPQPLAP